MRSFVIIGQEVPETSDTKRNYFRKTDARVTISRGKKSDICCICEFRAKRETSDGISNVAIGNPKVSAFFNVAM